jgi:hypothetical protein
VRRVLPVAAALVMLAAAVVLPAARADAATASLTVHTIDRAGGAVVTESVVVDQRTGARHYLSSDHRTKLAPGGYDVLVDIYNDRDGTDTLGAKRVSVKGSTSVTLDARDGKAIRAKLSPAAPAGYEQHFIMGLCETGTAEFSGWTLGGVLYAIPTDLSSVETTYSSIWAPVASKSSAPEFIATSTGKGLPRGGTATVRQSSLAALAVHAARGPQTGPAEIDLGREGDDPCAWGTDEVRMTETLPFSFSAYVSPGQWSLSERADDVLNRPTVDYAAGDHDSLTLNRAAWGPGGGLPYVWVGHNLYLDVAEMFTDPAQQSNGVNARVSYHLTVGGRTVLQRTVDSDGPTLNPDITKRGWYTLTVSAARDPLHGTLAADALSTASSLKLHFYADPAVSAEVYGYLTQFRPAGLDSDNRAKPSTTTSVGLGMQRLRSDTSVRVPSDSVRTVHAWASTNGGHTWHAVPVTHAGGHWTAHVANPGAGFVSLRSTVTDSHGSSSTTTVVRAYAIG